MSRLVAVVDWAGSLRLTDALQRAEQAMTAGGTRETLHRIMRPPFAAVLLSHGDPPPFLEHETELLLAGGSGGPLGREREYLGACRAAASAQDSALPLIPEGPRGRRCFVIWTPGDSSLTVMSEPNGQQPVYHWRSQDLSVISTEPKGIWAIAASLRVDADALLELVTVGQCLGQRTLLRDVTCLEPGIVLRDTRAGVSTRAVEPPRFHDGSGGDPDHLAEALNRATAEVMAAQREYAPHVIVELSGGMDSRYVLAAACRAFDRVESVTFGEPSGTDPMLAEELARRAGIASHRYLPDPGFLEHWGALAAWRADGMVSCVNAHGMDAVIADTSQHRHLLNGIGGDCLMGTFLHPWHFTSGHDPARGARSILATRRFHHRAPRDMLKPEVLARTTTTPEATLHALLSRYPFERMGNTMISYWLRHYLPRLPTVGIALEDPFAETLAPLVDPWFVRAATAIPLDLKLTSRVHRRALARLAPRLAGVRWERTGFPPAWPWPLHVMGRVARRFGLTQRPRPAVNHAQHMRTVVAPWVRGMLLSKRTSEDGYFLPSYLSEVVEAHLAGRVDHTAELSLALTLELWRRMFIEREGIPAALPTLPTRAVSAAA